MVMCVVITMISYWQCAHLCSSLSFLPFSSVVDDLGTARVSWVAERDFCQVHEQVSQDVLLCLD